MRLPAWARRLTPDPYILLILLMVVLATALPFRGAAAGVFATITTLAIAMLFFLHGAKLSREAVISGMTHWRPHLTVALAATALASRALGFSTEDEVAVVFRGSKKSLASGVPMASILFPGPMVGPLVLPLMIFHQLQLMARAVIAQRWTRRPIRET